MSLALKSDSQPELSDETFKKFQQLTLSLTGIQLSDVKRDMFVNRFARRLMALKLTSYEEYFDIVSSSNHPEIIEFVNRITTNLTYFFREPHHFEVLGKKLLPEISQRKKTGEAIRIWSAGCSAGQEPYSIAITALESLVGKSQSVKILSTDIHTKLVNQTFSGEYKKSELRGLNSSLTEKWFDKININTWKAKNSLRQTLVCKQLNLFDEWPFSKNVDVIVCRNVLIYFSDVNQRKVLRRFSEYQTRGSFLFLGHSETPDGLEKLYKRIANTVYERI